MASSSPTPDIVISRFFAASPERVFAQWLDAEALIDWFAPDGYVGLSAEADPRVGGRWRVDYCSDAGHRFSEHGVFLAIVPAERLVLSLTQTLDGTARDTTVVVTFTPRDGGTLMRFQQTGFDDDAWRDSLAEGWVGCLDKLGARLAATAAQIRGEAEIRAALTGNLCRCTGYASILRGALTARDRLRAARGATGAEPGGPKPSGSQLPR